MDPQAPLFIGGMGLPGFNHLIYQLCNADCDGDGDITVADATKIQKIVVGIN